MVKVDRSLPVASMSDIATAGELIARSGILGAQNAAEGFLIAATCHQTGMSFLEFAENYHLVKGRITKRADAMLASANRNGWKHRIIERSPNKAAIELTREKEKHVFELTWENALNEPFVYRGGPDAQMAELRKPIDQRHLKDKYSTPRSRMQMLWARVVSDAVRAVDPSANQGTYAPEEVEDFVIDGEVIDSQEPKTITNIENRIDALNSANPKAPVTEGEVIPDPAQAAEPNPFNTLNIAQPSPTGFDYSTCPIPGPMQGKKWEEMPIEHLGMAINLKHPMMEPGHYEAIRDAANSKGRAA